MSALIKALIMIGLAVVLVAALIQLVPFMAEGVNSMRQMDRQFVKASSAASGGYPFSLVDVMRVSWDGTVARQTAYAPGWSFDAMLALAGLIPLVLMVWIVVRLAQRFL